MRIDINQLEFIHKKLRAICDFVEEATGIEFTITSIYRIDDEGVHGQLPVRGIDLRMRSISVGKTIEHLVNNNFTYDPSRPEMKCAILHGKGSGLHIHLQVHPNTEMLV